MPGSHGGDTAHSKNCVREESDDQSRSVHGRLGEWIALPSIRGDLVAFLRVQALHGLPQLPSLEPRCSIYRPLPRSHFRFTRIDFSPYVNPIEGLLCAKTSVIAASCDPQTSRVSLNGANTQLLRLEVSRDVTHACLPVCSCNFTQSSDGNILDKLRRE
jgi:hypothetical protein